MSTDRECAQVFVELSAREPRASKEPAEFERGAQSAGSVRVRDVVERERPFHQLRQHLGASPREATGEELTTQRGEALELGGQCPTFSEPAPGLPGAFDCVSVERRETELVVAALVFESIEGLPECQSSGAKLVPELCRYPLQRGPRRFERRRR